MRIKMLLLVCAVLLLAASPVLAADTNAASWKPV